ncbi:MAG: XdhC family protein [Candidatus Hydrogenedentota bacterium]
MRRDEFRGFYNYIDDLIKSRKSFFVINLWDANNIYKFIIYEKKILWDRIQRTEINEKIKVIISEMKSDTLYRTFQINDKIYNIFIERFRPAFRLIILGAGHIAVPLVKFAGILGYEAIVIDDRADFANRDRFPDATDIIVKEFDEALDGLRYDVDTGIVIITRGHSYDACCLERVIDKDVSYIGMIGSKRRTMVVMNKMRENGISEERISRVNSPIGLPIGGFSPEEIALSIISEISCRLNKGEGYLKRLRSV